MEHYVDKKNVDLFTKNGIVTEAEMRARYEIELEQYSKLLNIEALTMLDMAKKNIAPAVIDFTGELAGNVQLKNSLGVSAYAEKQLLESLSQKLESFVRKTGELDTAVRESGNYSDNLELAKYYRNTVFERMNELRELGDSMEKETSADYWSYPSYGEILFGV